MSAGGFGGGRVGKLFLIADVYHVCFRMYFFYYKIQTVVITIRFIEYPSVSFTIPTVSLVVISSLTLITSIASIAFPESGDLL